MEEEEEEEGRTDREAEQAVGGGKEEGERDKWRGERQPLTDAESHYRGTTDASHESLGTMEELEHTCPHPRTVGHLIVCVFLPC